MKVKFSILFAAAVLALGSCSSNDDPEKNNPYINEIIPVQTTQDFIVSTAEKEVNKAVNDFGYRFFASATKVGDVNNMSVSPLSASMALSLVANSADDQLADAIADLLGVDDLETLNSVNSKLIGYLSKERNAEQIELANSVWYADKYEVDAQYKNYINTKYFAEVNAVNFTAPATPGIVDGWVSAKTHGVIPRISDAIDFNAQSAAMFINTLYFTGKWAEEFKIENNTRETFYGLTCNSTVDMMHIKELAVYAKTEAGEYLEKSFNNGSMITILMPDAGSDFEEVCKTITLNKINQIKDAAELSDVTLSMPKFKNESQMKNLALVLADMGLTNGVGKLSKMGIDDQCGMSGIQKTSVDVDEEGLTLAAVTAVSMATSPGWQEYKEVNMTIDRPFIYTVTDRATGSILLMGTVTDF